VPVSVSAFMSVVFVCLCLLCQAQSLPGSSGVTKLWKLPLTAVGLGHPGGTWQSLRLVGMC
jgi:hypothetical protein